MVHQVISMIIACALKGRSYNHSLSSVLLIGSPLSMEAHLLSFLCEHNLPISLTPRLLQLCKDINQDSKALNQISMSPRAATYKIVHGLGLFYNKAVICKLQKNSFSVNIDECTTSNGMKLFTIR